MPGAIRTPPDNTDTMRKKPESCGFFTRIIGHTQDGSAVRAFITQNYPGNTSNGHLMENQIYMVVYELTYDEHNTRSEDMVGTITVSFHRQLRTAWLENLVVQADKRIQHIATRLLRKAIKYCTWHRRTPVQLALHGQLTMEHAKACEAELRTMRRTGQTIIDRFSGHIPKNIDVVSLFMFFSRHGFKLADNSAFIGESVLRLDLE